MKRLALAASLALAAACTNEKAESLRAEIAKLGKERIEAGTVEKAKQEAADAEAALAASRAAVDQGRAELEKQEAERDRLKQGLAAEVARSERLRAEIDAAIRSTQAATARNQELDTKIGREKRNATAVRDQAAVLAREIRPADPAWATARRLDGLAEFLHRAAEQYPDDPVLKELAGTSIKRALPTADDARKGADLAARARDRLAGVFELSPPEETKQEHKP